MNSVAVNILMYVSCCICAGIPWVYAWGGKLDHEVWTLEDNAKLLSKVVLRIRMPTNNIWDPIIHLLSNVWIF